MVFVTLMFRGCHGRVAELEKINDLTIGGPDASV